ncbi:MAG: PilW family protein [Nitrospira sp.]|nr:PilW family protein [Nitrospira sp.]
MRKDRSQQWQAEKGFTLIEIMVGFLIAAFVVMAGFVILTTTEKSTRANDQTVETQQNARIAMEILSKDIKLAGFGMLPPPAPAVTGPLGGNNCLVGTAAVPISPIDKTTTGPDNGSDSIRLVVPLSSAGWQLQSAVGPAGFNQIQLLPGGVADMVGAGLVNNSIVSIGGVYSSPVNNISAGTNKMDLVNPTIAPMAFPAGTPVYWLQCATYDIGATTALCGGGNAPCLRRNGASIADGIEDIHFEYACDGCVLTVNGGIKDGIVDNQTGSTAGYDELDFIKDNGWNLAPVTPDKIVMVKIFLVARQLTADQGLGEANVAGQLSAASLQVSDHTYATDQRFRRRILTRTVETRNLGRFFGL